MRVVHLANFDGKGAAVAAYRLHRALLDLGVDSRMLVPAKRVDDAAVSIFPYPRDFASRARRRLRQYKLARALTPYRRSRPSGLEDFSDDRTVHGADALAALPAADIVNVHALRFFADYEAFFRLVPSRVPVVRTLHDMNFFTGGCHAAETCTRFIDRCGACPQLGSTDDGDLSRRVWERKAAGLAAVLPGRLHVIAPSEWLAQQARRSSLAGRCEVSVIPHGIDTEEFAPRDRDLAREVLGLPAKARVVLFVAEPINRRLKGFASLAEALARVPTAPGDLILLTAGSGVPPVSPPCRHVHLGYIGNDRLLSLVYSAADVFVMASTLESFSLTTLQALACALPVAAFDVTAVPELVRPGITGVLAPRGDVAALAAAIGELLADPNRRATMAANGRRIAESEYALRLQARRNLDLYERLVASTKRRNGTG